MPTDRACGIEVRADRLIGAEGERGELVLRRAEVVAVRVGSAPITELPWLEGALGVALALLTLFLVGTRIDGARSYVSGGARAWALTGAAAVALLARTFFRRPALLADLRSGDRRRMWIAGAPEERDRLRAALTAHRWPLVR